MFANRDMCMLINKAYDSNDGAVPNAQVDHHVLGGTSTLDCRAPAVHAAFSRDQPAVKILWTSPIF